MTRTRHPNKDIEYALRYAEHQGWRMQPGGSHTWGKMFCPHNSMQCCCGDHCITCIWSTPRNPREHAERLLRVVDNCTGANGGAVLLPRR